MGLLLTLASFSSAASNANECILEQVTNAENSVTVEEVRERCALQHSSNMKDEDLIGEVKVNTGLISQRVIGESKSEFNDYVITPHRINYFLPIISTTGINRKAYQNYRGIEEELTDIEAKFQLSLKAPLNTGNLLIENDGLYLGFTLQSWWQGYASNISKPFRETNYQPEIFYLAPLGWHPFNGNTGFIIGFEHQSNGRGQELSRSWNRLYGHLLYEKGDFALSLKSWYRIKEEEKAFKYDPDGDDNPDIHDYLGYFELSSVYQWKSLEISWQGRKNFSTNKGSMQLGMTFPLWGKLRGYVTAFDGYGESLIDYNHSQTRFGIGIALNNAL